MKFNRPSQEAGSVFFFAPGLFLAVVPRRCSAWCCSPYVALNVSRWEALVSRRMAPLWIYHRKIACFLIAIFCGLEKQFLIFHNPVIPCLISLRHQHHYCSSTVCPAFLHGTRPCDGSGQVGRNGVSFRFERVHRRDHGSHWPRQIFDGYTDAEGASNWRVRCCGWKRSHAACYRRALHGGK